MKKNTDQKANKLSVKARTPFWIWLLSLVPVLSTALYFLILSNALPFIKAEIFSAGGIIVLLLAMVVWGACGYLFAHFRVKMLKSILVANAFPMICAVLYTVFIIAAHFGADSLKDAAYIVSTGMGLFSYVGTYAYLITSVELVEVYLDIIFIVFTFFIGYTIGKSRKLKA
ncbi:MAG: hypothetical protein ACI4QR_04105 [Eubacteriales bacterium]